MLITPLSYQLSSKFNQNQQKLSFKNRQVQMMSDTVSFQSASKSICNPLDSAFIKVLSKDLQLDDKEKEKLKNIVWKYLRENRLESLGDLSGEDYLDEQVELCEKIIRGLNIQDEHVKEYVNTEIIKRCDNAENYIPYGIKEFEKEMKLEQQFADSFKTGGVAQSFSYMIEKSADDKMCAHICRVLRLSPEDSTEFRNTVSEFLGENGMKSLADFVRLSGVEQYMKPAELISLIEDKFNLDATELITVTGEIFARVHSANSFSYNPVTSLYVKDFPVLKNLLRTADFDYKVFDPDEQPDDFGLGSKSFVNELFDVMDKEADQKRYQNIFEIFKQENNFMESESFKTIKNSLLTDNQKADLILDLMKFADESGEGLYDNLKNCKFSASIEAILNTAYLTKTIMTKYDIPEMFIENIFTELIKYNPDYVIGGQNCSLEKIAYELSEKYHLPCGAEKEIIAMINEVKEQG